VDPGREKKKNIGELDFGVVGPGGNSPYSPGTSAIITLGTNREGQKGTFVDKGLQSGGKNEQKGQFRKGTGLTAEGRKALKKLGMRGKREAKVIS